MKRIIKNFISIIAFVLLIFIFVNKYQNKVNRIADIKKSISEQSIEVEQSTSKTLDETTILYDDVKETVAKEETIIATPSEAEIKFELKKKEFYDEIEKKGNADQFFHDNQNYIYELLKDIKFLGDSNVYYIDGYNILPPRFMGVMRGKSTTEQYDLVDEFIDKNVNNYVFWNGYNIKYFKDADDFVASYEKLIEKIKTINPNARVFVASLLPATKEKIEADLNSDFTHNMYRGEEYDKALEEHFKDNYLDTKKMIIGERHVVGDGVHFDPIFYKMLVCYVAFEVNGRNKKNQNMIASVVANDKGLNGREIATISNASGVVTISTIDKTKDIFGLCDIDPTIKYRYENLELLYQCEKYEEKLKSDNPTAYYMEDINEWIGFLDGKKFCGDSSINKMDEYSLLPREYLFAMPGKSLREQYSRIDKFDFKSCDTLVLWNGYVIKEFGDAETYIKYYDDLVKKIKTKNPNITIYACSLLPASKDKQKEDLEKGSPHDIYKGTEYDNAIKEYFGDKYIDTKFLVKEDFYAYDGYHLNETFYKLLIPYLTLYLKCQDMINNKSYNNRNIATKSIVKDNGRHIYMTFDDGPTLKFTKYLLDVMEQNDCKATFFVTAQDKNVIDLLKEISKKGHTIGAHTANHKYSIYKSVNTYFEDLYEIEKIIRKSTGTFTDIIRFPGGSGNISSRKYKEGIMTTLTKLVEEMGYTYYDWNVSSGDGSNQESAQTLTNAMAGTMQFKKAIVLFHETKETTVNIIPSFISWGKENGYTFDKLENNTMICHQPLNN